VHGIPTPQVGVSVRETNKRFPFQFLDQSGVKSHFFSVRANSRRVPAQNIKPRTFLLKKIHASLCEL
jgi:hypothetical protein